MAYVVSSRPGRWEIRESHRTGAGPRARTLASFAELNTEVIEHARERALTPLDPAEIRRLAYRAGAPVAESDAERAARGLLAGLAAGKRPRRALRRLLSDALEADDEPASDAARAAAAWIAADAAERGTALRDLLLLADRLPAPRRAPKLSFPPFNAPAT